MNLAITICAGSIALISLSFLAGGLCAMYVRDRAESRALLAASRRGGAR